MVWMRFGCLVLMGVLASSVCIAGELPDWNDEFDRLQARLVEDFKQNVDRDLALADFSTLQENGTFRDLDYEDHGDFRIHLRRIAAVAQVFRADPVAEGELFAPMAHALGWWLSEDYIDPNWWWTYIGFPADLSPVAALLGEKLLQEYPDIHRQLATYLDRCYSYSQTTPRGGGANLADMSYFAMMGAVMSRNQRRMGQIVERGLRPAIRWTRRNESLDGWRVDGTMFAHGPQLYNGTYGRELAHSASRAILALHGSYWELDREMVDLLEGQMLVAVQAMTFGNWFDYNAVGRAVSRPMSASLGIGFIDVLNRLLKMDPREPEALRALLQRIEEDAVSPENHYSGTRAFYVGEFISHIRENYYSSVRLISERTRRNEVLNHEGRRNRFFGDGVQFTLVHGDEYDELPPVWNFARLPGITAPQTENLHPAVGSGEPGRAGYAGVLSNVGQGIAAMRVDMDGLEGWKSWFLLERGIVALGSGFSASAEFANDSLNTTLNQTLASGEIFWSNATATETKELPFQILAGSAPQWVWHRDIGYLIWDAGGDLKIEAERKTGDWADIGISQGEVEKDVFSLYLDHGKNASDAGYAYMVLPAVTLDNTRVFFDRSGIEMLRRDNHVHAIRDSLSGQIMVAFLDAGKLAVNDSYTIEVDRACLLLVEEGEGKTLFTFVDPTCKAFQVNLKISSSAHHGSSDTVIAKRIDFPTGEYLGSSVSVAVDVPFWTLQ
jgi:chondroitin AC lyase